MDARNVQVKFCQAEQGGHHYWAIADHLDFHAGLVWREYDGSWSHGGSGLPTVRGFKTRKAAGQALVQYVTETNPRRVQP